MYSEHYEIVKQLAISCVVPTLNRGLVLCDTIKGLLDQNLTAHEIIVVDQTPLQPAEVNDKLRVWEAEGRIVLLKQAVPNASAARNRGAERATGDVLLFLDDDIQVRPDFLNAYADAFADPAVRGVAGQVLEPGEQPLEELADEARHPKRGWIYFNRRYNHPIRTSWLISCNAAVRREDFFEVGGMDENYFRGAYREEADFGRRWATSGRDFLFLPAAGLLHLGWKAVPGGGARSWINTMPGWHHYVGGWYFLLNHGTLDTVPCLLAGDLRSAGLSKRYLKRPWLIPFLMLRWLSALPVALWLLVRGPKYAIKPSLNV